MTDFLASTKVVLSKVLFPLLILFLLSSNLLAQNEYVEYLKREYECLRDTFPSRLIRPLFDKDVVVFGHVHGTENSQHIDVSLMQKLVGNGFKYIAVELDESHAFLLNKYLETGDEDYLDFVVSNGYFFATPQDASVALREKWIAIKKIYDRLPVDDQIQVLGFEPQYALDMVHLAHLVPSFNSGIPEVDSLEAYLSLPTFRGSSMAYVSTSPIDSGQYEYADYLEEDWLIEFAQRFAEKYKENPGLIEKGFGQNVDRLRKLAKSVVTDYSISRDEHVYKNIKAFFARAGDGAKLYASYGFSHALQARISGYANFAALLKADTASALSVASVLAYATQSHHLGERAYTAGREVRIKDVSLYRKTYSGYSAIYSENIRALDFAGRELLYRVDNACDLSVHKLDLAGSPFLTGQTLIRHKNPELFGWVTEADKSTTEYFQYLIINRNSAANTPWPKY